MDKAVNGKDQLRQRAVFALSEIFAISTNTDPGQRKNRLHAIYIDIVQGHAFGNYRDLLEEITYNPMMGNWLTYLGSQKENPDTGSQPDENYTRLF